MACMKGLMWNVRALHFVVPSVESSASARARALAAALKKAPLLHTLMLNLNSNAVGDSWAPHNDDSQVLSSAFCTLDSVTLTAET